MTEGSDWADINQVFGQIVGRLFPGLSPGGSNLGFAAAVVEAETSTTLSGQGHTTSAEHATLGIERNMVGGDNSRGSRVGRFFASLEGAHEEEKQTGVFFDATAAAKIMPVKQQFDGTATESGYVRGVVVIVVASHGQGVAGRDEKVKSAVID